MNLWVLNQAAGRIYRQDLFKEMQTYVEPLKLVDPAEFNEYLEQEAERIEAKFVELFANEESGAP